MKNDFTAVTQTALGIPVRKVAYNNIPQKWLGQVQQQDGKWISCLWDKNGKCKTRPEFNLK